MHVSRRSFVRASALASSAVAFPTIIPARVLGAQAPSKTLAIGHIGLGRIAMEMDVPGLLGCTGVRYVGVSDLDRRRLEAGRLSIEKRQADKGMPGAVRGVRDYRELIADPAIDAIAISTPDHWHAQPAIEAAFAGKDVYMQKPAALTIGEGRLFSNAMRENNRVFLLGSQQRSWDQFHRACELVRNGRLGRITALQIGLPGDPGGGRTEKMAVPENLDYDAWLGSTPEVYYTEERVHPQKDLGRPGWLRCEQFGAGMITGWGSHHFDIAHWAMGWEATGPRTIEGKGVFHTGGLWDVHGDYDVTLTYPGDVPVRVWNNFPNGVRFIGEKGWIFVSRGPVKATASDPTMPGGALKALDASDPALLAALGDTETVRLYRHRGNHHQNWIDCIRTRAATLVPAETAHRSCSACLLAHIGMKLGRRLTWDPVAESFGDDAEANRMLTREERAPYGARRAYERLSRDAKKNG